MRFPAYLLLSAVIASPAMAEPFKFKPLIDARLRYENVDQDGIAKNADAVTLRARIGLEASTKELSFLIEGEGTYPILEHYNSNLNGKTQYPVVGDPANFEHQSIAKVVPICRLLPIICSVCCRVFCLLAKTHETCCFRQLTKTGVRVEKLWCQNRRFPGICFVG